MTVTREQVRAHVTRDEPDYAAAAELGPGAAPHLAILAKGPDLMVACKAVYLASLIPGARSTQVLEEASRSAHAEIRVAVAAGIRSAHELPKTLTDSLLSDPDVGVRKVALRALAARLPRVSAVDPRMHDELRSRLSEVARQDPDDMIRSLASSIVATA